MRHSRFFRTAASTAKRATRLYHTHRHLKPVVIAVNQGFGLNKVLQEAKENNCHTVAICPNSALYQGNHADEIFGCENIMNISEITSHLDKTKAVFNQENTAYFLHPVYGYHAEKTELAKLCRQNNITWIGPSPELIDQLGHKGKARDIAKTSRVPVVPGFYFKAENNNADKKNIDTLLKYTEKLGGFPVIFKDPYGGGGRGNRIIRNEEELEEIYFLFKNLPDGFLVEKFLDGKFKHIEVPVMISDEKAQLFPMRDCSAQHRQQKLNEIAFHPRMAKSLIPSGEKIQKAAQDFADHIFTLGYRNAGTIEFLVNIETGEFYFMEMNTRLQVEHGVSDRLANINSITLQRKIASGEKNIFSENFNLAPIETPNICAQLRLYGVEEIFDADGKLQLLPVKGEIEHLRAPKLPNCDTEIYWQQNMQIDTSTVDPMFGILYATGNTVPQTQARLLEQLKYINIEGSGIHFNKPLAEAWLATIGADYQNLTIHSYGEFLKHYYSQMAYRLSPRDSFG